MKKVTLNHGGPSAANNAAGALAGLSGVLAVEVHGPRTVSLCGDLLGPEVLIEMAGAGAAFVGEEYLP